MTMSPTTLLILVIISLLQLRSTHAAQASVHEPPSQPILPTSSTEESTTTTAAAQRRRAQGVGIFLGGTVFYDINGNGSHDPNEPSVPDVTVQIRNCTNAAKLGSDRTNSIGGFLVALPEAGCYYARFDTSKYTFTQGGSDVNPVTGRTESIELRDGAAKFWYVGIIPPEGVTASPTREPTPATEEPSYGPTASPNTEYPTASPTTGEPTYSPTTGEPSISPSYSSAPSASPSISSAPSACVVKDVFEDNIMSSSPILRSSFGMIFSLSTPEKNETTKTTVDNNVGVFRLEDEEETNKNSNEPETIRITSISLRVLAPLLSEISSTDYQVWYREGDYVGVDEDGNAFDARGDTRQWTSVAADNSMGNNDEDTTDLPLMPSSRDALVSDTEFFSGAFPSDNNDHKTLPSTLLSDGGTETFNTNGVSVRTYLYRIPKSAFRPVEMPKYGGKVSFYITLDRALLQYGGAGEDEWDAVDVENDRYDVDDQQDMNVRIHVGEGVTSNPWTSIPNFYSARRFLGKVWYEQVEETPCAMHESAPSESPSQIVIPPLPQDVAGVEGEAIETRFMVSIFLQQDIKYVSEMDEEVERAFQETVLDFVNEEWIFGYCIWGETLDVEYQKLGLLEGVGRARQRNLRGGQQEQNEQSKFRPILSIERNLQTKITVLQVEISIKGVAYDDESVCPPGAIPATSTTYGDGWEETTAAIGIDYVSDNDDRLGERLKSAHEYFGRIFAVSADSVLPEKPTVENTTAIEATTTTMEETATVPLIPIIAAIAAAVLLSLLVCLFCFCRKRKRQQMKQEESIDEEEPTIETPKEIPSDSEQGDSDKPRDAEDDQASEEMNDEVELESPDATTQPLEEEDLDPFDHAWPKLRNVPMLEDIIMMRGLPRRRSDPNMATLPPVPIGMRRTRSIGSIREIWINLNKPWSYENPELHEGYVEQLLDGTLYPIDDPDLLYWEREKHLVGEDLSAPYVPHGSGANQHNFIDEEEAFRIESPREAEAGKRESNFSETSGDEKPSHQAPKAPKVNPLVMQQVEMLEAKWKQLREEYDDEGEYSDDDVDLNGYNVNGRIEQLMTHIEKLELERKMRLAQLKRQEQEEEELARKRMVRAGAGINYEQELNNKFRKKKKKKKVKKVEVDLEDFSSESSEEEGEDGEFDVKWMRLKVPLAAQDPSTMKSMVNKGKGLED